MSNAAQKKGIEKSKVDNARKMKGIYYIDQNDMEFKDTKKIVKKLELPQKSVTPCKNHDPKRWEIRYTTNCNIRKSEYACIIEAHISTRMRIGKTEAREQEDLTAD